MPYIVGMGDSRCPPSSRMLCCSLSLVRYGLLSVHTSLGTLRPFFFPPSLLRETKVTAARAWQASSHVERTWGWALGPMLPLMIWIAGAVMSPWCMRCA